LRQGRDLLLGARHPGQTLWAAPSVNAPCGFNQGNLLSTPVECGPNFVFCAVARLSYCMRGHGIRLDHCQLLRLRLLRMIQIPTQLQVHPEICGHAEVFCPTEGRTGRQSAPSVDQLIDALVGHTNGLCQVSLGKPHGPHEFLQQHFPWMRWPAMGWDANTHSAATSLRRALMIVDNFHLCWPHVCPTKT